jgi:hypothetical protein
VRSGEARDVLFCIEVSVRSGTSTARVTQKLKTTPTTR